MSCLTLNLFDVRRSGIQSLKYLVDDEVKTPWYWLERVTEDTSWIDVGVHTEGVKLRMKLVEAFMKPATASGPTVTALIERYQVQLMRLWGRVPHDLDKEHDDAPAVNHVISSIVRERATMSYNKALSFAFTGLAQQWQLSAECYSHYQTASTLFEEMMGSDDIPTPPERVELTVEYLRMMALAMHVTALERKFFVEQPGKLYILTDRAQLGSNVTAEETTALAQHLHSISYFSNCFLDVMPFLSNDLFPEKDVWISYGTIKMNMYEGLALYTLSMEPGTTKGDSRRRKAMCCFESALKELVRIKPGERKSTEDEINYWIDVLTGMAKTKKAMIITSSSFSYMPPDEQLPVQRVQEANALQSRAWVAEAAKSAEFSPSLPLVLDVEVPHEDLYHSIEDGQVSVRFDVMAHIAPRIPGRMRTRFQNVPLHVLGKDGVVKQCPTNAFALRFETNSADRVRTLELVSSPEADADKAVITHLLLKASPDSQIGSLQLVYSNHIQTVHDAASRLAGDIPLELELDTAVNPGEPFMLRLMASDAVSADVVLESIEAIGLPVDVPRPKRRAIGVLPDTVTPREDLPGVTIMFVIDATAQIDFGVMHKKGVITEVVNLMVTSLGLGKNDRVGVVAIQDDATAAVTEFQPMSGNGPELVCTAINSIKARGNHSGSTGTPVVRAVRAAVEYLVQLRASDQKNGYVSRTYEVVCFSDGADSNHSTHVINWTEFPRLRDDYLDRSFPIKIHTFAMGDEADKYVLEAMADHSRGDFSYAQANADGASAARTWLIRHLSNAQDKVATNVLCTFTPDEDIEITRKGIKQPGRTFVMDFSDEHATEIVWTVTASVAAVNPDFISVGTITLAYVDALTGRQYSASAAVTVRCSTSNLVRGVHNICKQLFVKEISGYGCQMVAAGSGEAYPLIGGEVLETRDSLMTGAKCRMQLLLTNRTRIWVEENASFVVDELNIADETCKIALDHGTMYVRTMPRTKTTIQVIGRDISLAPGTCVMISCQSGGVEVNCIKGAATVGRVRVLPMSQTSFKAAGEVAGTWTMQDDVYEHWRGVDPDLAELATVVGHIRAHSCRDLVSQSVMMAVRLLRRNIQVKFADKKWRRFTRQIALSNCMTTVKQTVANAVAVPNPHNPILMMFLDRTNSVMSDSEARSQLGVLTVLMHWAKCLFHQRSCGVGDFYTTDLQRMQLQRLADAKAKADLERHIQQQKAASLVTATEKRRRENMIVSLVPRLDIDSMGNSTPLQLEVLFHSMPKSDTLPVVIAAWRAHRFTEGPQTCIPYEKMAELLLECCEALQPDEFNLLMETLRDHIATMTEVIDSNRLTRSIYNLFLRIDFRFRGYVKYRDVRNFFEIANINVVGDEKKETISELVPRMEVMHTVAFGLISKRFGDTKATMSGSFTASTLTDLAIPCDVFVAAVETFFAHGTAVDEATANTFIRHVDAAIRQRPDQRENLHQFVARQRKESERDHLINWDLRHAFDCVTQRELDKFLIRVERRPGDPMPPRSSTAGRELPITPEILELVASPICILLGVAPQPLSPGRMQGSYWPVLHQMLCVDGLGFIALLKSFPFLSLRYPMLLRIARYMSDSEFCSHRLVGISRVLSALAEWVRLIVRIAYLEHDWDDPIKIPYSKPEAYRFEEHTYVEPAMTVKSTVVPNLARPHSAFEKRLNETFRDTFERPRARNLASPYPTVPHRPTSDDVFETYRNSRRPSNVRRFTGFNIGTNRKPQQNHNHHHHRPHTAAADRVDVSRASDADTTFRASTVSPIPASEKSVSMGSEAAFFH